MSANDLMQENKRLKKLLEEQENEYNAFFREMQYAYALHEMIFDKEGNPIDYLFLKVNHAFEKVTGLNSKDIAGKRILEVFPHIEKTWIKNYGKVVKTGKSLKFEQYSRDLGRYYSVKAYHYRDNLFAVVFNDISEHRKTEMELRKSEELYKLLAENATDMISLHDAAGNFMYVSPSCRNLLGYNPEDMLGLNSYYFIHPEDQDKVGKHHQETINLRTIPPVSYRFRKADNTYIWFETVSKFIEEDGKLKQIIAVSRDVSDRRKMEAAIIESEQRFRTFFDHSPIGAAIIDKDLTYLKVNDTISKWNRKTIEEHIGKKIDDLFPEIAKELREPIAKTFKNKKIQHNFERTYKLPTGQIISWLANIFPILDSEGKVQEVGCIIHNLGDIKRAELAMRESEELFRNTFEQAAVGICQVTPEGKFIRINQMLCEILGYTYDELVNMNIYQMTYPEDLKKEESLIKEVLEGKREGYTMEKRYIRKSGDTVWITLFASIVRDEDKKVKYAIAIIDDISQRKEMEAALLDNEKKLKKQNDKYHILNERLKKSNNQIKQMNQELVIAKERAEESDRLKSAFLANMSHEIRTPMNGIVGFSQMMVDKSVPEEKKNSYAAIIMESSEQLLNIVNDIIDISKIESGQVEIKKIPVNINDLMMEVYSFYNQILTKGKVNIFLHKNLMDSEADIKTDATKLKQILFNLVSNSVKFTRKGSITMGYQVKKNRLEFFVEDTGIGIPKEKQEIIWDRFNQLESGLNRSHGGTGLGLSISRAYVEMMGGKIWLHSEQDKGTTFFFNIPYEPLTETDTKKTPADSEIKITKAEKMDILIVEDEEMNYLFLEEILIAYKVNLIHARDGEEALRLFRKNKNIDIILMDIKLPGINGYEVTREIRKQNKTIPIIAQTAYALSGDREKSIQAGCNDYIAKPINKEELLKKIKKLTKK